MNQIQKNQTDLHLMQSDATVLFLEAEQLLETDPGRAILLAKQIKAISSDQVLVARVTGFIGKCLTRIGSLEDARIDLQQAIDQLTLLNHPAEIEVRTDLARLERDVGNLNEARIIVNQAYLRLENYQHLASEASLVNIDASIHLVRGETTEALVIFRRSLHLFLESNDLQGQATANINIGMTLMALGEHNDGLEQLFSAYQSVKILNNSDLEVKCILNIGVAYMQLGSLPEALGYFEQAIAISRKYQYVFNQILGSIRAAEVLNLMQRHKDASQLLVPALKQAQDASQGYLVMSVLTCLGETDLAQRLYSSAFDFFTQANRIAVEANDLEVLVETHVGMAKISYSQNQFQNAIVHLGQALELAQEADLKQKLVEINLLLSQAHEANQETIQALNYHKQYHCLSHDFNNEQTNRKTKVLTLQFDLEHSKNESEMLRLQKKLIEETNLSLETKVSQRTKELEEARIEIVTRLAVAAEYRDDHTGQHTLRVGQTSALIAKQLGLSPEIIETLQMAARLHDIGKIGIPDSIMLKPAKLSSEEFEQMKTHTVIGAKVLAGGKTLLLKMAEEIALTHHERWDGTGYPNQLHQENIPLLGRIVAICDVFDALMTTRPYKRAWTLEQARAYILENAGTHFDPEIVKVFLNLLDNGQIELPN